MHTRVATCLLISVQVQAARFKCVCVQGACSTVCTQAPCSCLQVNGPTGAFTSLTECNLVIGNLPCCGSWVCPGGQNCDCVFVPNLTTGFPTQADCYNAKNCCEITYPEYICDQVSILGPVGGTLTKCICVTATTGTGTYTGPNALYDCENDPTTCCSGMTAPDRWKCTVDCNCVLGTPFDQYATLHDCQTAINNNCCYTGVTKRWECVDFGKPVGCECVQTPTGFHSSKADCEAVTTDCCYTGTSNYDCVPGNNGLCKCVINPSGFGVYATLFDCENGIPTSNCCEIQGEDCEDDCSVGNISPTYVAHDGTYIIGLTQVFSLATTNILGLWLSGTFYILLDSV